MNTRFSYLYRDASNYKSHGGIVLTGQPANLADFVEALRCCFDMSEYFIAGQISVPEVFLFKDGRHEVDEDDHCWHEFEGCEATEDLSTDPRSPEEFLAAVRAARADGWKIFDVVKDAVG